MRTIQLFKRKSLRGISLLEVMLSLSIIAIILVMATRYFFTASESNRINIAKGDMVAVYNAVNNYASNHSTVAAGEYTGISTAQLITDGYIDNKLSGVTVDGDSSKFTNPWKTDITVAVANSGKGATITTTASSGAACQALVANFQKGDGSCASTVFTLNVGVVA
jgi:type II secretory pathway pseudopilin PulG